MSHFLGKVVKLIKTHKPKDEGEKDMLKRFEDHTTVFIRLETILESKSITTKQADAITKEKVLLLTEH